ncbi:MAG: nitrite reductase small subunit NirD [Colwellia sp.]|nr:nitrite reductase small subunit NirD [Colwellia sp.]MCW8866469.1 nitrite reductase small subunit NirD [Colwellia sp.]MCW9080613.1 nitrite reductase small subunit NirD [Colwellia sp.]
MTSSTSTQQWLDICALDDILPSMGRCALVNNKQIAIFRVTKHSDKQAHEFYAIDNYCPFSQANTLSRGITGSIDDKLVVASPLYKQHFDLSTGECLEDNSVRINTYPVRLNGNTIQLAA